MFNATCQSFNFADRDIIIVAKIASFLHQSVLTQTLVIAFNVSLLSTTADFFKQCAISFGFILSKSLQ